MTDERIKGKAEETKGKVKSAVGDLIGNEKLQAEGKAEELEGQARQEVAKATEQVKCAVQEIKGQVKGYPRPGC